MDSQPQKFLRPHSILRKVCLYELTRTPTTPAHLKPPKKCNLLIRTKDKEYRWLRARVKAVSPQINDKDDVEVVHYEFTNRAIVDFLEDFMTANPLADPYSIPGLIDLPYRCIYTVDTTYNKEWFLIEDDSLMDLVMSLFEEVSIFE